MFRYCFNVFADIFWSKNIVKTLIQWHSKKFLYVHNIVSMFSVFYMINITKTLKQCENIEAFLTWIFFHWGLIISTSFIMSFCLRNIDYCFSFLRVSSFSFILSHTFEDDTLDSQYLIKKLAAYNSRTTIMFLATELLTNFFSATTNLKAF